MFRYFFERKNDRWEMTLKFPELNLWFLRKVLAGASEMRRLFR